MAANLLAMASNLRFLGETAPNLLVMAANLIGSGGLQPTSDGRQPKKRCPDT